jgi:hypothetical protein
MIRRWRLSRVCRLVRLRRCASGSRLLSESHATVFFLLSSSVPRSLLLWLCPTPRVFNYTIILSDFTTTTTVQRLSSVYVLYILWTFFVMPPCVRTYVRTAAVGWVQPIRVLFNRYR